MSVVLTKFGQMRIIESDPVISRSLSLYGEWAMDELSLLSKLIWPGMHVLDAGAFIGTHSLAFSSFVGSNGKVFSFEPRREIFEILSQNLSLNNCTNTTPFNMGLAEVSGEVLLNALDLANPMNFGGLALVGDKPVAEPQGYMAHIATIDILKLDRIDLIKLDVEGMERKVLDGAEKTIFRDRPIIFCECNSVSSGSELMSWCKSFNYQAFGYLASAFNQENFNKIKNNIWEDAREFTLLLVPDEKVEEIVNALQDYPIFQLENIEDLVVPLLHKPQYSDEILRNTAAFNLLGTDFLFPYLSDLTGKQKEKNILVNQQLIKRNLRITEYKKLIVSLESHITQLDENLASYQLKNATLLQSKSQQDNLLNELRNEVHQLRSSMSWKITSPLRIFGHFARQLIRLADLVRDYVKTSPNSNAVPELFKKCLTIVKTGGVKNLRKRIAYFELRYREKKTADIEKQVRQIDHLHAQLKSGLTSKSTIIFDHNGGGGANVYTSEIIKKIILKKEHVLRVYFFDTNWFVQWISEEVDLLFSTPSTELLFRVLQDSKSTDIILNSLYGHTDLDLTTKKIIGLAKTLDANLDFKIHDFYPLCPSPHLSDFEQKYCGVPQDFAACKKCLKTNLSWYHPWFPEQNRPTEIVKWREPFAELLDSSSVITFFDESSVNILKKGFKLNDEKLKIIPHSNSHFNCERSIEIDGPLHIGIIGTLSHIKGGNVIQELCEFIKSQNLDIPVTVVGHSYTVLPSFVDVHGPYSTRDLADIVRSKGINMVLMFSVVPETFSYTISEAMQMGLPIVSFDIGAQGNRVNNYPMGRVIPLRSKPEDILKVIQSTLAAAQELKIKC